jgi:hypothetical protein
LFWGPIEEANFVAKYLGPALAASPVARAILIMTLDHNRSMLPWWPDNVTSSQNCQFQKFLLSFYNNFFSSHYFAALSSA